MRLVDIRRYPVKGLRGRSLPEAEVERIGFAGDRRWMIVDEQGKFLTQRQHPKLAQVGVFPSSTGVSLSHAALGVIDISFPDERAPIIMAVIWRDTVPARLAEPAGAYLSEFLQKPVRLVYLHEPAARPVNPAFGRPEDRVSFADAFPMLLTSTASLDDLNRRLGAPVSMDRFRPSLVIEGAPAWAEDTWRRVRIGGLEFRIVKPCGRCAVPTLDPMTGEALAGNEPIGTLASFHRAADGEVIFGQNAIPDEIGALRLGDAVEVLEAGSSNLV
jgi:uncharacterized protein YcbX